MVVETQKSSSGKWFEDQYKLTDLLALSIAVNTVNDGYIKKDAFVEYEADQNAKLPNLFIINNYLDIEKFRSEKINKILRKNYSKIVITEEDVESVERMIRYFKGLSLKAIKRKISDFEQSILNMISKEYIQYKDIGIVASLPNVYKNGQKQKVFNKLEKDLAKESQFAGKLHERCKFALTVIHKKFIWRSNSYLFVTKDEDNNLVKFFSNESKFDVNDNCNVVGYVKDWTEGKMSGGKETYLNRVKFVE